MDKTKELSVLKDELSELESYYLETKGRLLIAINKLEEDLANEKNN